MSKIVANDVNGAIGSARQCVLDYTLGALWSHRTDDHFAAQFLSHPQGFFERISVRLVNLEGKIAFCNPGPSLLIRKIASLLATCFIKTIIFIIG